MNKEIVLTEEIRTAAQPIRFQAQVQICVSKGIMSRKCVEIKDRTAQKQLLNADLMFQTHQDCMHREIGQWTNASLV